MPDIEVGQHAAPVRELGPRMLATRVENPQGSIQKTIKMWEHNVHGYVDPNNWQCWTDGVPR
eukprot:2445788-Alexandrium_andersonii.AAC.1